MCPTISFQRGRIIAIAGEDLIAQRHAAAAHHQGDVDLLAVRPMIARIAPLGLRVLLRLAFKVRAGHVVQQQIVVQFEQLSELLLEVFLQRRLVRQQRIQRPVQAVLVDLLGRHAQQIRQCAGFVKPLRQVQFAGGIAQPPEHQHRGHQRPGNLFPPLRQGLFQKAIQFQSAQQLQPQPGAAELPAALHTNALHIDLHPFGLRIDKQAALLGRRSFGAALHSQAALLIHRAQPGHHPLPRSARRAIALNQSPVSVTLAVLLSVAAPHIHGSILRIWQSDSRGLVVTTLAFRNGEAHARNPGDGNKGRPLAGWAGRPSK